MATNEWLHNIDKIELSIASIETMLNALPDIPRLDTGIVPPEIRPVAIGDRLNRLTREYALRPRK